MGDESRPPRRLVLAVRLRYGTVRYGAVRYEAQKRLRLEMRSSSNWNSISSNEGYKLFPVFCLPQLPPPVDSSSLESSLSVTSSRFSSRGSRPLFDEENAASEREREREGGGRKRDRNRVSE